MSNTKEEKKLWDAENFKWVIVKADGSKKDLYKPLKSKTKKTKTKSKKKKNGNKTRQKPNKRNKRKG